MRGNVRRLLVVAVAAALIAPAAADAKSPPQGLACGAPGCTAIADRDAVYSLMDAQWQPFTLLAAPRPAPYFLVVLYAPDPLGFSWTFAYVPSRHAVKIWLHNGAGPSWRRTSPALRAPLEAAVRGLTPYRAPRSWARVHAVRPPSAPSGRLVH
jgi:hypothetical protein